MTLDLIEGYLAHLRAGGFNGKQASKRTIESRRSTLTRLHEELPWGIDGACEDELKTWLWQDGWMLSTRDTYFSAMSGFYRWAHKRGHFDFNPTEEIARPKPPRRLPRPCTDEQLDTILTKAWEPYLLWSQLAAYGGLRCIEISRLHREHVTEDTIFIHCGKGDKEGVVPTHPVIWDAVKGLADGPITNHDEHYVSVCTAHFYKRRLGLHNVSLHRLRHWFGTNVQKMFGDLRVTQELMRHDHPSSTAGYTEVVDKRKTAAINLLPVFGASVAPGAAPKLAALAA
jgi:integrase